MCVCVCGGGSYLGAQGRGSELRHDGGQQAAGVGDQVRGEQLHLLPQALPHRQHHDYQHLLQNLPETGHTHQVLLRLRGRGEGYKVTVLMQSHLRNFDE